MLSFFRTKSTETNVDKIINSTKDLSLNVDETSIDAANMESNANSNDDLRTLCGYQNENDLRNTIFGI